MLIDNTATERASASPTISNVLLNPPTGVTRPSPLAIPELQGLRAAGCCLVFLAHVSVIIYPERFMRSIDVPAGELFARAVIGFFILSGLVLSLPYVGEEKQSFSPLRFYFQRLLRLYPAYLVSVLFALAIRFGIKHWVGLSSVSPWAQRFWGEPVTAASILQHLLPIAVHTRNINPVYWTLSLEIQACLLFPLIVILVRHTRHWSLSFVPVIFLTALSHFFPFVPLIRICSYFLMGAYIAKYNVRLNSMLRALPYGSIVGLSILIITFFWAAPQNRTAYRLSFLVLDGLLAILMVAVQSFRPLAGLANVRPIQRFAELSYCFYLVHLPILAACAFTLRPITQSALLTILAALSISLMVAYALHRYVEQPVRAFAKSRTLTYRAAPPAIPEAVIEMSAATKFGH
jgi:peptidoglycan/LPS O-acetylase OafA/YrhL